MCQFNSSMCISKNVTILPANILSSDILFWPKAVEQQTDIAISKSKPGIWLKKHQPNSKAYRTYCIIILTLSSWPSDREGKRSNARCLPESPHPWDWETQWQEDELTVGQCRAINQDRHEATGRLLSPRGQRLWDTKKPLTYLPVMAQGDPTAWGYH